MKYLGFSLSKLLDPQNGNFIKGVSTIHQKSGTAIYNTTCLGFFLTLYFELIYEYGSAT